MKVHSIYLIIILATCGILFVGGEFSLGNQIINIEFKTNGLANVIIEE